MNPPNPPPNEPTKRPFLPEMSIFFKEKHYPLARDFLHPYLLEFFTMAAEVDAGQLSFAVKARPPQANHPPVLLSITRTVSAILTHSIGGGAASTAQAVYLAMLVSSGYMKSVSGMHPIFFRLLWLTVLSDLFRSYAPSTVCPREGS